LVGHSRDFQLLSLTLNDISAIAFKRSSFAPTDDVHHPDIEYHVKTHQEMQKEGEQMAQVRLAASRSKPRQLTAAATLPQRAFDRTLSHVEPTIPPKVTKSVPNNLPP
jgi:hypothetical protein